VVSVAEIFFFVVISEISIGEAGLSSQLFRDDDFFLLELEDELPLPLPLPLVLLLSLLLSEALLEDDDDDDESSLS